MKLNTQGKQAYKLVKALLIARKANYVPKEQIAYDNLRAWCDNHNADMGKLIEDIQRYMIKECVADCQNGLPWVN